MEERGRMSCCYQIDHPLIIQRRYAEREKRRVRCDVCDLCISVICTSDIHYYIHLFQNMSPRCEEHQQEAGLVRIALH